MANYAPLLISTDATQNDDYSSQYQAGTLGLGAGPDSLSWTAGDGHITDSNPYSLATAGTGTGIGADSNLSSTGSLLSTAVTTGTGLGTMGTIGAGVGGLIGSYTNATTDTGSSVLSGVASGAASGAAIGSVVPGIGTAVGAVVGGILGGLGGLFGSSSKKKAAQKAYQQSLEEAIAPAKQQEANYLQNQGLLQKAISNYGSGYTPGGYKYTNPLLANKSNQPFTYGQPTQPANLPNFNTGPSDVAAGGFNGNVPKGTYIDTSKGIPSPNGAAVASNGNLLTGTPSYNKPNYAFNAPAVNTPTAPSWSGNQAQDQSNLNQYQQNYIAALNYQNQQRELDAMNNYSAMYGGNYAQG